MKTVKINKKVSNLGELFGSSCVPYIYRERETQIFDKTEYFKSID